MTDDARDIQQLVHELGIHARRATDEEAAQIRALFARQALPTAVTPRVLQKHLQHVEERREWPSDTTPEEYLESLRATVMDPLSGIYLTFEIELDDWVVYFVGRVRREWRGLRAGQRIVVLFRREPSRWITGFQVRDGDAYIDSQQGCWVYETRWHRFEHGLTSPSSSGKWSDSPRPPLRGTRSTQRIASRFVPSGMT